MVGGEDGIGMYEYGMYGRYVRTVCIGRYVEDGMYEYVCACMCMRLLIDVATLSMRSSSAEMGGKWFFWEVVTVCEYACADDWVRGEDGM
jgi:hypothetical protein